MACRVAGEGGKTGSPVSIVLKGSRLDTFVKSYCVSRDLAPSFFRFALFSLHEFANDGCYITEIQKSSYDMKDV